jgi:hypothetical protein
VFPKINLDSNSEFDCAQLSKVNPERNRKVLATNITKKDIRTSIQNISL